MVNHRCVVNDKSCVVDELRTFIKPFFLQGSTSGFGKRLVLSTLARGDRVIATGRNTDKLKQLVSIVKSELADNIRTVQLDVTEDEEEIKAKIDQAAGFWGCIDVLVNNAGGIFLEQQYSSLILITRHWFTWDSRGRRVCLSYLIVVSFKLNSKKSPYSSKYLRRQFETNLFGLMDVTNATLPYLRKAKDGCVVVFGSRSAWRPEVPVSGFTSLLSNRFS